MRAVWTLVSLVLVTGWTGGATRVKLNSIRTLILRETPHAAGPRNRTAGGPWAGMDFTKLYQCISDLECHEGSYCHAPSRRVPSSRCKTCRRRKRRCHRDGMCCQGNRCSNNMCVPDGVPDLLLRDEDLRPERRSWRRRGAASKLPSVKGQVGDVCVRSSDCAGGLCCARHFWTRLCKRVLQEGQVCTLQRPRRHKPQRAHLEVFQRCRCGEELDCRPLRQATPPAPATPPGPAPPGSSPHTSLLSSSSSSSSSSAVKTRLHVCQRN